MWNWNWVGHYSLLFFLLGLYFMLHKKKHQFWVGWLIDRRQLLIFMCNSIFLEIMSCLTSSPYKINDKVISCNHSLHYCNATVSEKQFEVWSVKRIILCKKCDSGLWRCSPGALHFTSSHMWMLFYAIWNPFLYHCFRSRLHESLPNVIAVGQISKHSSWHVISVIG